MNQPVSVTIQFPNLSDMVHALSRVLAEPISTTVRTLPGNPPTGPLVTGVMIAPEDRPDVGALETPVAPAMPTLPAAAAFGGAVVQAAPLVPPVMPEPASIPPSAATVPTAAPAGPERDASGMVWDARIHASTKTKTQPGLWTAKRNVPADFKAQVEADLRGLPAPAAAAPTAPPAAPLAPQAPAAPQAPVAKTFAEYAAEIGAAFSARPLDSHAHMAAALALHGMQHIGQLSGKPELIPAVDAEFRRLLG